jgi:hypothetical protein
VIFETVQRLRIRRGNKETLQMERVMNIQDSVHKKWTVIHDEIMIQFDSLDAAIWYAAGAASVSKCIRQINSRERLITLVPIDSKLVCSEKCAA